MSIDESNPVTPVSPFLQQFRNPPVFKGEAREDPTKWLKEYERVAKFNRWDDTMCLANAYFFLASTAKQWFMNNEDQLTSWDKFESELKRTFGETKLHVQNAEDQLKHRAQKTGESTQSYIQSVLGLCHEVDPKMSEDVKVSHLMKGVAEDVYQILLAKEIQTAADFMKWCLYIDEMHQKRLRVRRFERLPNVVPQAAMEEQSDLVSLIRQIIHEEVQKIVSPAMSDLEPQLSSIESLVREEVENVLAPISKMSPQSTQLKSRRQPTYSAVASRMRATAEPIQRKTDVWRTADNRPVCFHCGRPGHVVRYCRERRAVFDAYRANRSSDSPQQPMQRLSTDDYSRLAARNSSPSPSRGRSPNRRFRSPSPYRRPSQSPRRRNEEN